METGGLYSLKVERLATERQIALVRLLLCITASLIFLKLYHDQYPRVVDMPTTIGLYAVLWRIALLITYSFSMWAIVKWKPAYARAVAAFTSFADLPLIAYLMWAHNDIPFHNWFVFYVVSIAIRYGWQFSIMALSASVVSTVFVASFGHRESGFAANIPANLGFSGFLLVLAYMFGTISEKQLRYQASLAVVNDFRAELAGLTNTREIIEYMLIRTKDLLSVEQTFFLPASRGADASEAPGLRSVGADPVLLSTFRETGGLWNVEEMLREQRPLLSNRLARDRSLPKGLAAKMGLRNLVASPMMVRGTPVGVVYAANRKSKPLSNTDMQLLELVATQAAPVVENALLWERLREAATSEERLRIARDLHDNFLQTLAAIKIHLERCKILVAKDSGRALEGIDKIHQIATRGLAEVRSYLSELRLMGPEPSRFKQAVERATADAALKGGFQTEVNVDLPDDALPPNVALAAFQMIRELLNNAAAHSSAKHVQVNVDAVDGKLTMEVRDNGHGFDVKRVRAEKASAGHLGLIGVEERARQSNGVFVITSDPGKGTTASATLLY